MGFSSASSDSTETFQPEHLARKEQKFEAFDFLRAIFSLAVVAYKTAIFSIPKTLIAGSFTYALSDYVLSGMFGAMAVPVFLQISLFLFCLKSEKTGLRYFLQKRLPRLVFLYLFWVIAITTFDVLFIGGLDVLRDATSSVKSFALFVVSGNSTPYFFFFSLTLVTIVSEILLLILSKVDRVKTKRTISYFLLIAACVLVFGLSTIEPIVRLTGTQSSFLKALSNLTGWDYTPINFLPYAFTAAITMQEYREGKLERVNGFLKRKLAYLGTLSLTFFVLEWVLTSNRLLIQVDQAPLDHYIRLSLVFGSWFLLYLAVLSNYQAPAFIRFLSSCSLGIYGFHVFFTFKGFLALNKVPVLNQLFQTIPVSQSLVTFTFILTASIVLTLLFRKNKILKGFV